MVLQCSRCQMLSGTCAKAEIWGRGEHKWLLDYLTLKLGPRNWDGELGDQRRQTARGVHSYIFI